MAPITEVDVLVVGTGFGGIHAIQNLRKLGYNVKALERGTNLGGTWYWNRYPGARVDSDLPIYQFSDKDLWKDWTFTERFPGYSELQEYFAYVDKKWDISKDVLYNTEVVSANFDESKNQWVVACKDGKVFHARWFVAAVGFASKKYLPPYNGLETFKGTCFHTADWPKEGMDLKGKRIGVVGTGASGVQVIQETGPIASHITVFQRTPNLALPMVQTKIDKAAEEKKKASGEYDRVYKRLRETFAGFDMDFEPIDTKDATPEERRAHFEKLWAAGGFSFWLAAYKDMLFDQKANDEAYAFWAEKVRARLDDPTKKDILAPLIKPHAFGTKRPCLEQRYYEVLNQKNVDIIDVSRSPIMEINATGVRTELGQVDLDVLVLATGFDSVTGGMTQIDIKGTDGETIKDKWAAGLETYLGIMCANFPNMFFLYGAQAPTAFSNGPTCVEVQGEWLTEVMRDMKKNNISRLEPTMEAQKAWCKRVQDAWDITLFPGTKSWYQGSNIPGKKVEPLNWAGGIPAYIAAGHEARQGYKDFKQEPAQATAA